MLTFTMNNGNQIPAVGSGTNSFAKTDGVYTGDTKDVVSAIRAGYRFFDTAESYGNEEAVGKGIKESGIPRDEFFICTKMATRKRGSDEPPHHSRETAREAVERSLKKLDTDYIDLYLIHMPWDNKEEAREVWAQLEDYYREGVLKNIGVSNFTIDDLSDLLAHCEIPPVVDQVRINPESKNTELIAYLKENNILPMAWGPLRFEQGRDVLTAIGEKYGKNWAQVILNYNCRKGYISIPKSHSFEHQKSNLEIFDFELTEEEIRTIDEL
ncbi:MAG: aldo/keto reductase [Lachnospiraceae bacterium]|nr:aldo/keto reductase [Lachnospiraceae bacterium]